MNDKSFHHSWDGEHAVNFAKSVENMKKSRYIPFAKEIHEFVNKFVKNKPPVILDLGCGPGLLLLEIANLIPKSQLIGIDNSKDMLQIASEKVKQKGLDSIIFKQGPAEDIPLPDDHNDVAVCLNSLHDFNSTKETISEVYRTMKEEGIFILKDKNGAFPKWKVVLGFIPLICKSGFKRTLRYFKSNELWLNPEKVKEYMETVGFEILYLRKNLDYLIVGKK